MKQDFCFTFYDGDAARDMTHMNRLQRGAYTDIIISIRKFGHLTKDQIKMILSKDFEECFPSIELVLLKDNEGKFYIEWLELSLEKAINSAKKQKDKIDKRWNKNLPNEYRGNTAVIPRYENGNTAVLPYYTIGDGDGDINEIDLGKSENPLPENFEKGPTPVLPLTTILDVDLLLEKVFRDDNFKIGFIQKGLDEEKLLKWLEHFNMWLKALNEPKKAEKDYRCHFINWLNKKPDLLNPETYDKNYSTNGQSKNGSPNHTGNVSKNSKYVGTGL